jgi:predicted RNA-binding Zn-ribbon protein involved in translation (DUF1610 family)
MITEKEFQAVCDYLKHRAAEWWKTQPMNREAAICDACSGPCARNDGYLIGSSLWCPNCFNAGDARSMIRRNPDYAAGNGTLQNALNFAKGSIEFKSEQACECIRCGATVEKVDKFCPNCGDNVEEEVIKLDRGKKAGRTFLFFSIGLCIFFVARFIYWFIFEAEDRWPSVIIIPLLILLALSVWNIAKSRKAPEGEGPVDLCKTKVSVEGSKLRAIEWWKDNGSRSTKCDVCNNLISPNGGYLLHTIEMVSSDKYVDYATSLQARSSLTKINGPGMDSGVMDAVMPAMSVLSRPNVMAEIRKVTTPWLVCDNCIGKYFT